jgi:hypothetical protein
MIRARVCPSSLGVDVKAIQAPLGIFLYGESMMKYTMRCLNDFNVRG